MPALDLAEFLESSSKFEKHRSMLIFSKRVYRPTGERVIEGFRYFACGATAVKAAVTSQDVRALLRLPFALDEEGVPHRSAVRVDIAYTESGAFVALQPVELQRRHPVPVAPLLVLEDDAARAVLTSVRHLDQSC